MRESFGGSFIVNLILVFIVVFISFMAVTVSYAKAFRVKNGVINLVEQYQYSGKGDTEVENIIESYLGTVYYNIAEDAINGCSNEDTFIKGVCIKPLGDDDSRYYKVITFISIQFPFFGINLSVPISGETKVMYS